MIDRIAERSGSYGEYDGLMCYTVEYDDPYSTDAETALRIESELQELTAQGTAYLGLSGVDLARKRKSDIDQDNPATRTLGERLPAFNDWLSLVPTAAALDSLYRPDNEYLANGKPLHPELASWFRVIADGRGIRSRAAVVGDVLISDSLERVERPKWLSLASGAGQPVMKAAKTLYEEYGMTPEMTFVDKDASALQLLKDYAREENLSHAVNVHNLNILQRAGIGREPYQSAAMEFITRAIERATGKEKLTGHSSFDVVEAVGITEYLKPDDWTYRYGKVVRSRLPMAGARTFLSHAYDLVKPGGVLLTANMLDTHPQLGFTLNVIQWPHIQPRSIDEMMRIFNEAGIDGTVEAYLPSDGAYAVYKIRKPEV